MTLTLAECYSSVYRPMSSMSWVRGRPRRGTDVGLGDRRSRCADFCDLAGPAVGPPSDVHGPWRVSRPVAREIFADVGSRQCALTVDLAVRRDACDVEAPRRVRLVIDLLEAGDGLTLALDR